jgi:hypothetical protein
MKCRKIGHSKMVHDTLAYLFDPEPYFLYTVGNIIPFAICTPAHCTKGLVRE